MENDLKVFDQKTNDSETQKHFESTLKPKRTNTDIGDSIWIRKVWNSNCWKFTLFFMDFSS